MKILSTRACSTRSKGKGKGKKPNIARDWYPSPFFPFATCADVGVDEEVVDDDGARIQASVIFCAIKQDER